MSKKYNYLYRLIIVAVFLIAIPLCIFVFYFWQESYREVQKSGHAYYEKVTDSFQSQFDRNLDEMKNHAVNLSIKSKKGEADGKSLYTGGESLKDNTYWYYEVVRDFKELNDNFGIGNCLLYYYEWESVISTKSRRSIEQYISINFGAEDAERLADFFNPENWRENKIIYFGNPGNEQNKGILLVGYCTSFGMNKDKVMVFYELTESGIMEIVGESYELGVNFYVLNSETEELLVAFGEARAEKLPRYSDELRECLGDTLIFDKVSNRHPLTYLTAITDNSRQSMMDAFSDRMQGIMVLLIMLIAALCILALYLEYKPIYGLLSSLEEWGEDELSTLKSVLDRRYVRIQEQEQMIKELLLNYIVYGSQISEPKLKKLGLDVKVANYSVYLLENRVLLTAEADDLEEKIWKNCACRLYIADLMEKDQSVMVAFHQGDIEKTAEEIRNWLQQYFGSDEGLKAGKVVKQLQDIRISFRSCLNNENIDWISESNQSSKDEKSLDEKQRKLWNDIYEYLEVHYRDQNLSQVQVADALHMSSYTLSRIFKTYMGVSYTDYVNAKRLEYAKELLLTTDLPVQEIAVAVGYDRNYFYRIFRARFGMSATEFREH